MRYHLALFKLIDWTGEELLEGLAGAVVLGVFAFWIVCAISAAPVTIWFEEDLPFIAKLGVSVFTLLPLIFLLIQKYAEILEGIK